MIPRFLPAGRDIKLMPSSQIILLQSESPKSSDPEMYFVLPENVN